MPAHLIERQIVGQMLRFQAGRQIQCPACGAILDAGHAVSLDLVRGSERIAARMICADCADAGAIRRAYRAGRAKCPSLRIQVTDGRLVDDADFLHSPESLYRVGPRGSFTARLQSGPVAVAGIAVTIFHPEHAAHERWFAYRIPRAVAGYGTWHLVHEPTGLSAGGAHSLRGCIHNALAKFLRMPAEKFENILAKARRQAAKRR